MSKLSGIKGFDYKRLAKYLPKTAGVLSNVIISVDKKIIQRYKAILSVLEHWASFANNAEDRPDHIILYLNGVKFDETLEDAGILIGIAKNNPDSFCIAELTEYEPIENAQVIGNRQDLLPENWQGLLTDNLPSDESDLNNEFDDETFDTFGPMTDQELEQDREFSDANRTLPRFVGKKIHLIPSTT